MEIVVVTAVDDTTVHALPVALKTQYHDADTVLLPAEASTLEQPIALWRGLGQRLPWCVLDRQISHLSVPLAADGSPTSSATGYRYGSPIPSPAARAAGFRAALADTMDLLSTARWAPQGNGDLAAMLKKQGLRPAELIKQLGVQPPRALALLRGQTPLTHDEADLLTPILGATADQILAANPPPPDRLVHELSRPARRDQIRRFARHVETTEHNARQQALFTTFALAARQERSAEEDWPARVDRFFDVHLAQESEW
ncbi:hypothetical protein [Embleya sp. NPDC020886]|uniref:hypothetical protein n=1 Tax=Embleya sp. NPDC020886 TaxID=3363980 RepID=UPI003788E335